MIPQVVGGAVFGAIAAALPSKTPLIGGFLADGRKAVAAWARQKVTGLKKEGLISADETRDALKQTDTLRRASDSGWGTDELKSGWGLTKTVVSGNFAGLVRSN